jgi:hypothetical protein
MLAADFIHAEHLLASDEPRRGLDATTTDNRSDKFLARIDEEQVGGRKRLVKLWTSVVPLGQFARRRLTVVAVVVALAATAMTACSQSRAPHGVRHVAATSAPTTASATVTSTVNTPPTMARTPPPSTTATAPQLRARQTTAPARSVPIPTTVSTSTTSPPQPAIYHGGPVIHDPVVDIIVWGKSYPANILSAVQHTLQALAGSAYFNTLSQYFDRAGPIHNDLHLHDTWTDPTPPPGTVAEQVTNEIAHARAVNGWNIDPNTMFLVLLPPGVSADGCGWHGRDTPALASGTVFAVVPFADAPGCATQSDAAYQLSFATYVAVHELAEAITDPFTTAWYDFPHADSISVINEIADVCVSAPGVSLPLTDAIDAWLPELYSSRTQSCQASSKGPLVG